MSHAEKCPICKGKGNIPDRPAPKDGGLHTLNFVNCHGCDGKGWVTVEDKTKDVKTTFVTNEV